MFLATPLFEATDISTYSKMVPQNPAKRLSFLSLILVMTP
jgi:hypothetical protein